MCHHELWPTSVSHSFSFFNSSLGLAREENSTRKLLSLFLHLFFKILLFQVTFLISFSIPISLHYSVWFVIAVWFASIGYDYTACVGHMDSAVHCPQKAVKLNNSLTPSSLVFHIMSSVLATPECKRSLRFRICLCIYTYISYYFVYAGDMGTCLHALATGVNTNYEWIASCAGYQ